MIKVLLLAFAVALAGCTSTSDPDGPQDMAPQVPRDTSADSDGNGDLYEALAPELQELFTIINEERATRGLAAVVLREALLCAADSHSADIGERRECTHDSPDGADPGARVNACGGGGWNGEIVACGQRSARAAVDAWLDSPGHNHIMLDDSQRAIGIAMHENFWTAVFDN